MIKHIVMFRLADVSRAEEVKERFNKVIENVSELKKGEVVINSAEAPDSNYTVALLCDFENIDDLNAYQVHPVHKEFGAFIGEIKTDRACIDYEY
ncbi:MAG: Dabb family protein [Ruminococcus flavefaciens]|nr:Dabb family protein [Ruminococcus flavefaciens]MCM1229601.1 Dabb family protein [Ruminococcus flavefaciens]